ncbi:hypothetical protein WR25_02345 [Diploscapter pachys]|uniref:Uncharacterized protein n=1 Tax=Diploscapter pachys TaxID=2018661 RepID=A0A2A2K0R6_9BILA|nr:hypothetical protein WR25_02345 [Diploscapter pachys]
MDQPYALALCLMFISNLVVITLLSLISFKCAKKGNSKLGRSNQKVLPSQELAAEEATRKVSTKRKEGKSLRKSRDGTQEQRASVRGEKEKETKPGLKPYPDIKLPTDSERVKMEEEREKDKQQKIAEGFYQSVSDEDDTLIKVPSLNLEPSNQASSKRKGVKRNAPKDKDGAAPAAYLPEVKTAILWHRNSQKPHELNKIEAAKKAADEKTEPPAAQAVGH